MKKKVSQPAEPFDYELAKQKVKEQFRTGKSLYGKDGAFAPLLQDMLNSILETSSDNIEVSCLEPSAKVFGGTDQHN